MPRAPRPLRQVPLQTLNEMCRRTMLAHVGIEFTDIGPHHLTATMPVDDRTVQPFRLLHGGASVVLAESLGSMAAHLTLDEGQAAVGLEINANHLKGVRSGGVTGTARAIHTGRTTQVWQIEIEDESGDPVCISRITMAVLQTKA